MGLGLGLGLGLGVRVSFWKGLVLSAVPGIFCKVRVRVRVGVRVRVRVGVRARVRGEVLGLDSSVLLAELAREGEGGRVVPRPTLETGHQVRRALQRMAPHPGSHP